MRPNEILKRYGLPDPLNLPAPTVPGEAHHTWMSLEAVANAPDELTIYSNGRAAGLVYPEGACVIGRSTPSRCIAAPPPTAGWEPTETDGVADVHPDYMRYAHPAGQYLPVETADGDVRMVASAGIGGLTGHHDGNNPTVIAAAYNREPWVRGRYHWVPGDGLVFVGAVNVAALGDGDGIRRMQHLQGSSTSIHYEPVMSAATQARSIEFVGAALVTAPGARKELRPTRITAAASPTGSLIYTVPRRHTNEIEDEMACTCSLKAAAESDLNADGVISASEIDVLVRDAVMREITPLMERIGMLEAHIAEGMARDLTTDDLMDLEEAAES